MQVVSGVVRPKIGTVAKDRPIFHQTVAQESLLAGHDVRPCEQELTVWTEHLFRDWRFPGIGTESKKSEHKETEQEN